MRFSLAENGCSGLMDLFLGGVFIIVFAVSIWLALRGTFRKRGVNKRKPEPITLTIILVTFAILFIGEILGQDFKGSTWIYAQANANKLETQALTLRKNGTFKVDLGHVDFSCYFSGHYQKLGDTIILDKEVIAQTNSLLTTKYLFQDTLLVPLNDTNNAGTKFSDFVISIKE